MMKDDELWLKKIKERLDDYSEPLPDTGWERLEKALPASAPMSVGKKKQIMTIFSGRVKKFFSLFRSDGTSCTERTNKQGGKPCKIILCLFGRKIFRFLINNQIEPPAESLNALQQSAKRQ